MFVVEFGAGVIAGSSALMADASDMLGDALVYAVSLYALARSARWKAGVAMLKGGVILALGIGVAVNAIAKIESGVPPSSALMLGFGALALAANLVCLRLLWGFRAQDVNMASTFECSRNDVISNVGVLLAAGLVAWLDSPWPDIAIGSAMARVFLRSALRVMKDAAPQLRAA
jgi:Co/Zn/Cd efflux system component